MPRPSDRLRERLLAAGVAPRHVRRYIVELGEHLADLTEEELRSDHPRHEAEARASARLGTPEALAAAMIVRKELRGWDARAPWAAYLLAPAVVLAAGLALTAGLVVATVEQFRPPGGSPVLPVGLAALVTSISTVATAVLPILIGWSVVLAANGRRRHPFWPVLGLVALGAVGGAVALAVSLPTARGSIGELDFDFALIPPFPGLGSAILRMVVNLALTLLPFGIWRFGRKSKFANNDKYSD